ncbi:hypothetical protein BDV93DRAFT_134034 [Ceratobasidium sp. AG-I]|nr:hypothetical protein BDV93DRAFT_134034 [Ceratobasidium sp. AG-I]
MVDASTETSSSSFPTNGFSASHSPHCSAALCAIVCPSHTRPSISKSVCSTCRSGFGSGVERNRSVSTAGSPPTIASCFSSGEDSRFFFSCSSAAGSDSFFPNAAYASGVNSIRSIAGVFLSSSNKVNALPTESNGSSSSFFDSRIGIAPASIVAWAPSGKSARNETRTTFACRDRLTLSEEMMSRSASTPPSFMNRVRETVDAFKKALRSSRTICSDWPRDTLASRDPWLRWRSTSIP